MKTCSKCKQLLPESEFNRAKWLKSGLRPDCKQCYSKAKKALWAAKQLPNRERTRLLKQLAAEGLRQCKSCERVLPLTDEMFTKSGLFWNSQCRECDRARVRRWAIENQERYAITAYANCAARYAAKRQRTPRWLSTQQRQQMQRIYARSRRLRKMGMNVHVDHIVPLVGRKVSGLHVPWNLQILPASVNCRKSNKLLTANC